MPYSSTIHKSQGSTYTNNYIDLLDINRSKNTNLIKKLLYVAVTRASNKVIILCDENHLPTYPTYQINKFMSNLKYFDEDFYEDDFDFESEADTYAESLMDI